MAAIVRCLVALVAWLGLHAHQPAHVAHAAPVRASRGGERTVRAAASCGGWRDLVASYEWDVDKACSILWCESRGDPNARNRSGATGLMQVKGGSTDPATNMAQAHALWLRRRWEPWECA